MKILHISLNGPFTDNLTYQENMLAKFHVIQGHEVTMLTTLFSFDENGKVIKYDVDGELEYLTKDGYKIKRIENKKGLFSKFNIYFRRFKKTFQHIKDENPDILFIHGCQFLDIIYVKKFFMYKQKNNEPIKIFVDNHADYINSAKNWLSKNIQHKIIWRNCAKLIEPCTDMFYGVTPVRCDFLHRMYKIPSGKIKLLNLGVDSTLLDFDKRENYRNEFCEEYNISNNDFIIVTGGKIDQRKNIHLLLQAFKRINNRRISIIVFGSISADMKDKMEDLLAQPNVHYLGWISTENAIKLFILSDLGIFPGTHSVYWEQVVGCELPAIFKYWPGMTHVDSGGNCIFLKDDSVYSIQKSIEEIIDDKDKYSSIKYVAKIVAKEFSYYDIAKRSLEG